MVTVASMSEGMFPLLCCSEKTGSQAVIATVLYRLGQKNKVSNVLAFWKHDQTARQALYASNIIQATGSSEEGFLQPDSLM